MYKHLYYLLYVYRIACKDAEGILFEVEYHYWYWLGLTNPVNKDSFFLNPTLSSFPFLDKILRYLDKVKDNSGNVVLQIWGLVKASISWLLEKGYSLK